MLRLLYFAYMADSRDRTPQDGDARDDGRIEKLRYSMYSRSNQPRQRPRRSLRDQESDLPTDWEQEDVADTTPVREEPTQRGGTILSQYSWSTIFFALAVAVFVIAGSVAVWFILSGSNVVSARNIDISVYGPRTIEGGTPLELQIEVRNNNGTTLEYADLIITYPEHALMQDGFKRDAQTQQVEQRVSLGSIEAGGSRSGTVSAVLLGQSGERYDVTIALEYRLENSSALFFDEEQYSVLLSSDALDVSVEASEEAISGQRYTITAFVTSQTDTTLSNVVVHPSYPFGFTVDTTEPEARDDGSIVLGDLAPGETREVYIAGSLEGQTDDERTFRFVTTRVDPLDQRQAEISLTSIEQEVSIRRPFLDMELAFGESDVIADEFTARPGESVTVDLTWRNNLDVPLSNVVIAATLGGEGLNPYTVAAGRGFYRSIDSIVLWDKATTNGDLEYIPAGESGRVSFTITPYITDELLAIENPTITFELHASGNRLSEGNVPELIQSTVTEELKMETVVTASAEALYFDNPLGSVGPLPPKVQHETTYGILWELSNSTNRVRDGRVTATLPPYVRWLGTVSPSAERVTFNERDGTITWYVGNLLNDTGVGDRAPRRVIFALGLVPSASQVGQAPELLLNQTFRGIDDFTETQLQESFPSVDTRLNEEDFAGVYGTVVR